MIALSQVLSCSLSVVRISHGKHFQRVVLFGHNATRQWFLKISDSSECQEHNL